MAKQHKPCVGKGEGRNCVDVWRRRGFMWVAGEGVTRGGRQDMETGRFLDMAD